MSRIGMPARSVRQAGAAQTPFRNIVDPATAREYRDRGWWGDVTIGSFVRRHAEERPEDAAFISDSGILTWRDYETASDRLAAVFTKCDLTPGARIGVLLPDSATVHVTFLAAEKAGLTIVGIGVRAGTKEILHLLDSTGAAVLVTLADHSDGPSERLVEELTGAGAVVDVHIVVPRFEQRLTAPITANGKPVDAEVDKELLASRGIGPDDLYLINSTSGTTGLPKCVMHHQNRWMYFHQRAVANGALDEADIFLVALPTPFGFGQWTSHFTPTILGAPTVLMERFDATSALKLIEAERATVLCCVSTQFIMMLNDQRFAQRDLSSLRVMFTGGEAVPFKRAAQFEAQTGCKVLQFFGSNETGLISGTSVDDPPEKRLRTAGRIPLEMQIRLYEDDRDVTTRGWGQPACRGPATCIGYFQDATANGQLFTSDGWMLMSDICSIDDDGYVSVTGRLSDIIIRGGKNISALEVEDEVSTHPLVALAAAVALPDDLFGERVCVYVELRDSATLTLDDLRRHLAERGTSREIWPEQLVVTDSLPRSSGGKVAKGPLRDDARSRTQAEA